MSARWGARWKIATLAVFAAACARSGQKCAKESPRAIGSNAATPPTPSVPATPPPAVDCVHKGSGKEYAIGPGKPYASIGDVPFEKLAAGDTVRIFWRPEPYREKVMIGAVGTEAQPVVVCGVAGPNGELPVIDGENATTRRELDFPFDGHQVRGLVTIGHKHGDPWTLTPKWITLQGLEIKNGTPPFTFTDKSGQVKPYSDNASGIFVQRAEHVTIRGCVVHGNNNGIYVGTAGDIELTKDVLIEGNRVYGNGSVKSFYQHNVYNEASNVTYQYNWFGAPRIGEGGVQGANIKERSAGVVIRYNWIEDGAHIIDLVDAQEAQDTTRSMDSFHTSFVYGNVIVRGNASGSIVHYGGDSGILKNYRKGVLRFYDNTLVVKNGDYKDYDMAAAFELSTDEEHLDARNNIFFCTAEPTRNRPVVMLGARDEHVSGVASFAGNWVSDGWEPLTTHGGRYKNTSTITGLDKSKRGADPGFTNAAAGAFDLAKGAAARGVGVPLPPDYAPPDHAIRMQYAPHQGSKPRAPKEPPTPGAFED